MIKNYTSTTNNTFNKIQKILTTHKAKKMMFDYDDDGKVEALTFIIDVDSMSIPFRLPAKVDNVEKIFLSYKKGKGNDWELTEAEKEQAYRTAWANIRDWLDAQMALIDTEQVELGEVFLPYAVQKDGRTYFEHAQEDMFLLGEK